MPRNGSGSYTLPAGINPVITQTLITSGWANTTMADLAAAITQSLSKDGQTVPTANLPMGGFKHTGVGDPTLRNNYASLGFVQDGSHLRLTGVLGANDITATLVGGGSALAVGQIVQLIPVGNNTGPVTLAINGEAARQVRTDLLNSLASGNLVAGRPYLLSWTGNEWVIISANAGVNGYTQSAMSGWDRPSVGGAYPQITQVNATTVAIPAGKGRIIKPSARDLSGVTEVSWAAQNVVITNVAVSWSTMLGINAAGAVVQFTGNFNPSWARDNVLLGIVAHINGQINEVTTQPAIFGDMIYAAYDVAALLNNTLAFGGRVFANAASPFHIDLEAGAVFSLGSDSIDVNGPNTSNFPAAFDLSFFPVTGASVAGAATTNVPVTQYDPAGAGVVTPIPGGASTTSIHRLFLIAGEYVFLYGQSTYADLNTALSQISVDDAAVIFPAKLVNATLLCYIVAQKNCADLKNTATARIVAKGGSNFSLGSAGSISDAPINGLTYGRKDATWVETVPAPVGPQATLRQIYYYTNTFARWSEGANADAETGLNAGSNWVLRSHADAGNFLNVVLEVNRATSKVTIPSGNLLAAAGAEVTQASAATQALLVRQTGTAYPYAGTMVGAQLRNGDTTADSKHGISFWGVDGFGNPQPGASIMMNKTSNWAGGLDIAPAELSFWTRPAAAGAQQVERLRINSVGDMYMFPGGGIGIGCDPRNIGPIGNPLPGAAKGLAVYSPTAPAVLGLFTDNNAQVMSLQFGAAGIGIFDAGLSWQPSVRKLNIHVGGTIKATFDAAGTLAMDSGINLNTNVQSSAANLILGTWNAPGSIYLRPNGNGSGAGQVSINNLGDLVAAGTITAGAGVYGSGQLATVVATGAAGDIYLRPNGPASGAGELRVNNSGSVTINGTVQAAKTVRVSGQTDPTTGFGLEFAFVGTQLAGASYITSYDRDNAAFRAMTLNASSISIRTGANVRFIADANGIGFFGTNGSTKQTVVGSRGGNAALASLLAVLAGHGLLIDGTTA